MKSILTAILTETIVLGIFSNAADSSHKAGHHRTWEKLGLQILNIIFKYLRDNGRINISRHWHICQHMSGGCPSFLPFSILILEFRVRVSLFYLPLLYPSCVLLMPSLCPVFSVAPLMCCQSHHRHRDTGVNTLHCFGIRTIFDPWKFV